LDLDGVVWLAGHALPGAAQAVTRLRQAGQRVVFLTNNSGPLLADHVSALAKVGIDCAADEVATSAQAAAEMLPPSSRVAVVGDRGILEALAGRGAEVVPLQAGPDTVVVGRTLDLDYGTLAAAATAVRGGARFIATNTDSTFPTGAGSGLLPGAGALVAFVATAAGRSPEVAGKPHQAMVDLVKTRFGAIDVMVGDRPDTDGLFAQRAGARFGLVLSGVTTAADLPVQPEPDRIGQDLGALVSDYLGPA
jgi:HAD superfamily hydrolase (TIGR01450 family)